MKTKITFLTLLLAITGFSQIPAGYYNNATGTGYTLKTQLKNIITNGHNAQSYNSLWTLYNNQLRDQFYDSDGTLLDMYSENPTGPDPYNFTGPSDQCGNYNAEGQCYNKEHLVPQAYFASALPMYSDAHHVVPADGKVNGWRDNLPFGVVAGTATNGCNGGATNTPCVTANTSKLGNNLNSGYSAGYSAKVFEPVDEFKGDIARSLLYFATRYETQMPGFYTSASSSLESRAMFDGSSNKVFSDTFLSILLTWHNMDPVSAKEIAFNNAIYSFQGNRNPYIDHPEYAQAIWGGPLGTKTFTTADNITIYPNPTNNSTITISSESGIDNIQLISINGQLLQQINKPAMDNGKFTISNLPQGFYLLKLDSENRTITKKIIAN